MSAPKQALSVHARVHRPEKLREADGPQRNATTTSSDEILKHRRYGRVQILSLCHVGPRLFSVRCGRGGKSVLLEIVHGYSDSNVRKFVRRQQCVRVAVTK